MFEIYNSENQHFTQWEQNHVLTNPCMKAKDEVVFRNSSGKTIVAYARTQDGQVVVDVPNVLLQYPLNILVGLGQGLEQHSECETVFSVVEADKPEDYEFVDNIKLPSNDISLDDLEISWNDLADKPFYEQVTENFSDTLEFDTEYAEVKIDTLCKVSDIAPLDSDFVVGSAVSDYYDGGLVKITTMTAVDAGLPVTGDITLLVPASGGSGFVGMVVRTEGATIAGMTAEVGLYLNKDQHRGKIELPGYTGFVTKETVVKPLDEKYMPILTSPNGTKFKLSVNDSGTISATEV